MNASMVLYSCTAGMDLTVADLFPTSGPRRARTDPSYFKPPGSDEEDRRESV
jgi:hypothetical protein